MGGSSSPPPPAPDYRGAAEAQGASSEAVTRLTTRANRPQQYTPWGTSVWRELGGDRWRQDISLSPTLQDALNAQQSVIARRSGMAEDLLGRVGSEISAPAQFEPLEANEVLTGGDARSRAEEAVYNRLTSRLDPQWEQERERMESQLWNQGLRPGDEAWDTEVGNFERARTDAYDTAANQAIITGGAEAEREFGMDFRRRQQALAEELMRRGVSINEINALLTGQQVGMPSMPGFAAQGQAQPVNYLGAANAQRGAEIDRFNAQQAQTQGLLSGLTGLATAGAAWAPFVF